MTQAPSAISNLLLTSLHSFRIISRHLATDFFTLTIRRSEVVCAFPCLPLDNTSKICCLPSSCCVHAPLVNDVLACAACLVVQIRLGFLFNGALIGSNQNSLFQFISLVLLCPLLPRNVCGMSQQCFLTFSGQVLFILIILASPILSTCLLGSVIPKSFISHKTAPAGPLTFFHEVASHTCLFHAALMSSSHCPVQTACAWKHVAAHANSCSISKLLISWKSEIETEGFFLAALANCLLNTSLCVGTVPGALHPSLLVPNPSTKLCWYLSSHTPF